MEFIMVDKMAEIISQKIVTVNGNREDKEIYVYGLQILLNTFFSISIVLLIGFIFNELWGTVVFLFCYCSLRVFAGGLHANTNNMCMAIFIGGYIFMSIILNYVEVAFNVSVICVLMLINVSILMWAPVDVPNNPIPISKKKVMKKKAFFISSTITIVIFVQIYNRYNEGKWAFAGVCWFSGILIAGKIKNIIYFRRHYDEKGYKKNLSND